MDSKTQTELITSASGGIGYELVKLFARDRYKCWWLAAERS
jgi:NAD(P)-dependent dehydrogenase (short-subunit alcohol dehydrogenase family)